MPATHLASKEPDELGWYEIRIKGHLDERWAAWFAGMTITRAESGETLLRGPVVDQAALHGLLRQVRDLGLPLLSVIPVEPQQAHRPDGNKEPFDNRSNKETNR